MVQRSTEKRIVGAKRLLLNLAGALEQGARSLVISQLAGGHPEAVERLGQIRVIGGKRPLAEGQGFRAEIPGGGEISRTEPKPAENGQGGGHLDVLGPQ